MKTSLLGTRDIRTPADPQDKQTTDARSALPPVEFAVAAGADRNSLSITDRQAVSDRASTVSYRVYFLPAKFAPTMNGVMATSRRAAQKVSNLVAEIAAPSRGTILTVEDTVNFGSAGYYFCVGVNRVGVEAPAEHMVAAP
jgi:hypothetical protein